MDPKSSYDIVSTLMRQLRFAGGMVGWVQRSGTHRHLWAAHETENQIIDSDQLSPKS